MYKLDKCFCGADLRREITRLHLNKDRCEENACFIFFTQIYDINGIIEWNFWSPKRLFFITINRNKTNISKIYYENDPISFSTKDFDFDINNLQELEDRLKLLSTFQ